MQLHICPDRLLGAGYFGFVYFGFLDATPIAAKECCRVSSVHEEARLLRLCDHENIMRCSGVLEFQGTPYLIMELAREGTLEKSLGQNSFSPHAKRLLVQQICRGLDHLHNRNIVHRDIKALNLLLKNITPPHLVISDFGAAQTFVEGDQVPSDHDIVRDAVYTFKSDIFLAGLVAFQVFEDLQHVQRETLADEILSRGMNANIFTDHHWKAILDSLNRNPEIRPTAIDFHNMFSG